MVCPARNTRVGRDSKLPPTRSNTFVKSGAPIPARIRSASYTAPRQEFGPNRHVHGSLPDATLAPETIPTSSRDRCHLPHATDHLQFFSALSQEIIQVALNPRRVPTLSAVRLALPYICHPEASPLMEQYFGEIRQNRLACNVTFKCGVESHYTVPKIQQFNIKCVFS